MSQGIPKPNITSKINPLILKVNQM